MSLRALLVPVFRDHPYFTRIWTRYKGDAEAEYLFGVVRSAVHRLLSADGDSVDRQDSADRLANFPPVRREYSNMRRGMAIAISLAGHRPRVCFEVSRSLQLNK